MKTIIVACGGGIATSAAVATKINTELEDRGFGSKAKAEAVDIKSLDMFMQNADIYVSITPMRGVLEDYSVPTVSGIPLLSGIGREETMQSIIELL